MAGFVIPSNGARSEKGLAHFLLFRGIAAESGLSQRNPFNF
jgi:hypothetical protein